MSATLEAGRGGRQLDSVPTRLEESVGLKELGLYLLLVRGLRHQSRLRRTKGRLISPFCWRSQVEGRLGGVLRAHLANLHGAQGRVKIRGQGLAQDDSLSSTAYVLNGP